MNDRDPQERQVITGHTPESLIAFEREIADLFNTGKIRAPVHLDGGCEEEMLAIFQYIKPTDWCLSQWRSHYVCLLKGVPPDRLKADILRGRSITLSYPEHHILTSAIAGGILPIAVGLGMGIKRRGTHEHVHCFVGDMTSEMGLFHECSKYAYAFNLPVRFIVQDNELSVCTPTYETWRARVLPAHDLFNVNYFPYKLPWPHSGAGTRVNF